MQDPPTLTIDPVPPKQGQTAKIIADGPLPMNVTISFEPDSIPDMNLTIGQSGEVEFTVPDNAESMQVTDDDGVALGDSSLVEEG